MKRLSKCQLVLGASRPLRRRSDYVWILAAAVALLAFPLIQSVCEDEFTVRWGYIDDVHSVSYLIAFGKGVFGEHVAPRSDPYRPMSVRYLFLGERIDPYQRKSGVSDAGYDLSEFPLWVGRIPAKPSEPYTSVYRCVWGWPFQSVFAEHEVAKGRSSVIVRRGVPLSSRAALFYYDPFLIDFALPITGSQLPPIPPSPPIVLQVPRTLPTGVLWRGLTANAGIAICVTLGFVTLVRAARSAIRIARGGCLACGYPLGHSARCSECGQNVLAK
jgi:hypothetical protein